MNVEVLSPQMSTDVSDVATNCLFEVPMKLRDRSGTIDLRVGPAAKPAYQPRAAESDRKKKMYYCVAWMCSCAHDSRDDVEIAETLCQYRINIGTT